MNSIFGFILAVTLAIPVTSFAQESPQSSAAEESLPNTAESVAAQSDDADTAEFQRIVQLAVLQPDTAEFDDAWSDYIKRIHRPDTDVDATVDKVIKAAETGEGSRKCVTPCSPGLPTRRLRITLAAFSSASNARSQPRASAAS